MARVNTKLINSFRGLSLVLGLGLLLPSAIDPAIAQDREKGANAADLPAAQRATYADLITLADRSALVVRAQIRRQTVVSPERAPGLAPGFARLYIEAETQALIAGSAAIGESLVYLVDVPLTDKGKPPKLKKREMLLFANEAGSGPKGETQLQLMGENAQLDYSAELESRLSPILRGLLSKDAPPVITGISDALAVPGTLTGESETQIFLSTRDGSPVSLTVLRRPSQPAVWGVSWGEIIDSSARAPEAETLRWYRLACSLPESLPSSANLAREPGARQLAVRDYEFIMRELGPCAREIT